MVRKSAVAVMLVVLLAGCAAMRQDKYCKWGLPIWGAVLGGVGGGLATSETGDGRTDAERAGGAVGGTIAGGLLGWLVGHYVCEEAPEAAPPPPAPPPPPPPPAARKKIESLTGPSFDFNKATLTAEGRRHVDHAVSLMKESPTLTVVVEGHTDSIGSDAYNMKLSQRRADTVRDYMIKAGISGSRIKTEAFGKTKPIASNKTAEGRAQNRRVDIISQ
jgi:OOP family OmpA-OmpF porin